MRRLTVRRPTAPWVMANEEDKHISEVVTRLEQRYPRIDADTVADIVHTAYQHLAAAPVRDFVPLLVERGADQVLSHSN